MFCSRYSCKGGSFQACVGIWAEIGDDSVEFGWFAEDNSGGFFFRETVGGRVGEDVKTFSKDGI